MRPHLSFFHWRSLKVKFALLVVALLSIIAGSLSTFLINRSLLAAKGDVFKSSSAFAQLSVKNIGDYYGLYYQSGYAKYHSLTEDLYKLQPSVVRVRVVRVGDGQILADSAADSQNQADVPPFFSASINKKLIDAVNHQTATTITEPGSANPTQIVVPYQNDFGARPYSLIYDISYAAAEAKSAQEQNYIILITILIDIGAAAIIAFVVNRTILNPLGKVASGAQKIAAGELNYAIAVHTHDEVEDVAQAVGAMALTLRHNIQDLKALDEAKSEFILIASHNLRTPLTTLQGYLQLIDGEHGAVTAASRKKSTQAMNVALSRLNHLVEELLSIVSLRGNGEAKQEPLNLKHIVDVCVSQLQQSSTDKGVIIEPLKNSSLSVWGEASLLPTVFTKILSNAIKFTPAGGHIKMKTTKDEGGVSIAITDQGEGMTSAQVSGLFQPFHRATPMLTYNYEGVGLGLYVSRLILDRCGATLTITSKLRVGTTVTINFPPSPIKND